MVLFFLAPRLSLAAPYLFKDLNPGSGSSNPANLTNVNGTLFFTTGQTLWKSDGTDAGTVTVKNLPATPDYFINANGTLFFNLNNGNGNELWKSDGTDAGTVLVMSVVPGDIMAVGSSIFFKVNDPTYGIELWRSDGTQAGTGMVKDINPGAASAFATWDAFGDISSMGGICYFNAIDGVNGYQLWRSDGTASGTWMVKNIGSGGSFPVWQTPVNGTLFFIAGDGIHGTELWKSDGTAAGTVMVKDINPGAGSSDLYSLAACGGKLYFSATDGVYGHELWKSDGTDPGTAMVKDSIPGSQPTYVMSGPRILTDVSGTLFYKGNDGQLWKSDGTDAGTILVKAGTSSPSNLTNVNGILYFDTNNALWKSDGTDAGTVMSTAMSHNSLTTVNGKLYFAANDGVSGWELWSVDSKPASAITSPLAGSAIKGASCTVTGTATDYSGSSIQIVEVSTDGGTTWNFAMGTTSWSYTWTLPADGSYIIQTRATDNLGNVETVGAGITVSVDYTAPSSAISAPGANAKVKGVSCAVSGTATDGMGSGVKRVEVSTNGGTTWNFASGTTSWTYTWTLPADGSYTIQSRATDNANNVETPATSVTVTVDNTPPVVSAGADKTTNTEFTQTASATDATSGVASVSWSTVSGPGIITFGTPNALSTTISASADGTYVIQFTATDAAGNSASSTMNLTWDTTPPRGRVYAYIANSGNNTVSVVDTSTNSIVDTVGVGGYPIGVAVNPAGTKAYVANGGGDISVIDTSTNSVIATVGAVSPYYGIAVNPADTRAYVANTYFNNVSVIDTSTNTVVATVGVGSYPFGVAVNPSGTRVYVANNADGNVSVIDTSTNTVVATIGVGSWPRNVAFNPAGTRAYVSNYYDGSVSVIDTSTNSTIDTIGVGTSPMGIAVNPAGTMVYVANFGSNNVSVIDVSTNTVVATVGVGTGPLGVSVKPDGTRVYVTNQDSNDVSVIDISTNAVVGTLNGYNTPKSVGIFVTPSDAVRAGPDRIANAPFTQTGSATDADGTPLTYLWTERSGPGTVTFSDATVINPTISADKDGAYAIRFTATDRAGNSSYSDMTLVWDTTPPSSSITAPSGGAMLNGYNYAITGTSSDTGSGVKMVEVGITPSGGSTTWITLDSSATTDNWVHWRYSWILPADGSYTLQSRATDYMNHIETTGTVVSITVDIPPVVSAGGNKIANTLFTQAATATDATAMTYSWTKQSGPGNIIFGTPTALSTTISADTDGWYKLRFTATDTGGNSSYSEMWLLWDTTVPVVSAGPNKTANTQFTQTATAVDADSPAMTYSWSKVSGPGTITLGTPTALSTTVSASADGTYTLRFTATDSAGNAAYSDMTLIWNASVTTVTSSSSNNTSSYGASVTFTAKVAPLAATGTVTIKDGSVTLGIGALSGGTATFSISSLTMGTHSNITAAYGGDVNYAASTSIPITQTVTRATASPLTFAPKADYDTGIDAYSVATADFNGDGKLDLAVVNYLSGTVSILLGNGDGTFRPNVEYGNRMLGNPTSVVVGDFNGDGNLDLAVATYDNGNVSVLLGNGDGTFQAKVDYAIWPGSYPYSVTTGDFNGDGKLDLAVTNYGGGVSILMGNGNGTFQKPGYILTGDYSFSVTAGDFNGDGKPDLAVANWGNSTVSVLLGNGDGTFQTKVDYAIGHHPRAVTVGDFNGDGNLDLAAVGDSGTMSVLLGNGDGTFQAKVDYGIGNSPNAVTTGDFNGDGKLDLAVANSSGTVSVLLGNGDGTFQTKADFGAGGVAMSVAAGDFNGDGRPDLVTANYTSNTVSILLGSSPLPSSIGISASPNPSLCSQSVTFTASVSPSAATGTVTFKDGAATLGTGMLSGGIATFTTSTLSIGTHTITAAYGGDANYAASTSSGITQTVNRITVYGSPELPHYKWNASMMPGGTDCTFCHATPDKFLALDFRQAPGFCYSCHNAAGTGHELKLYSSQGQHAIFVNATAAGRRKPTYGNITAGERNNIPASRLKDGYKVVCMTCHNDMKKSDDPGRVCELTTNPSGDYEKYYLQNGGWSAYGNLAPKVYMDSTLWGSGGPTYSKNKKGYLVSPSEYAYNEMSGFIRFKAQQAPTSYVYVTLYYPYLRAPMQDNALCSDCHTEGTHKDINCLNCHQAHNTNNLKGIREKVRTSNFTTVNVRFLRYTGPNSFADGDATYDGICEVCHTQTKYYRRDGTGFVNHSGGVNYDRKDCTSCHSHATGFTR